VSRGKIHAHLGMRLDFTAPGQAKMTVFDCLKEMLVAWMKAEPNGDGTKTSAAPDNLFKTDEDCKKLNDKKAVAFHNTVAKTLHTTKRARPDACTLTAFLTARVQEPNEDNWIKLGHLMKCLQKTLLSPLILSANGSGILKWWVDASFAVHPNMRGHSGGGLSMGRGFPIVSSTKQKLNTRSSTEMEVVGANNFVLATCWMRCFVLAQGHDEIDNIVFQDNKSTMLLEKNGKALSSKHTKHTNNQHFFTTDRIDKGEVSVVRCPAGNMTGIL